MKISYQWLNFPFGGYSIEGIRPPVKETTVDCMQKAAQLT